MLSASPAKADWSLYGFVSDLHFSYSQSGASYSDSHTDIGGGFTAGVPETYDCYYSTQCSNTTQPIWIWNGPGSQPTVAHYNASGSATIGTYTQDAAENWVSAGVLGHNIGVDIFNYYYYTPVTSITSTAISVGPYTYSVSLQSNGTVKGAGLSWFYNGATGVGTVDEYPSSINASAQVSFGGPY